MHLAVPLALALLAFLAFAARRTLTYLRIFQQEEYDSRRFLRWLARTRSFDMRASVGVWLAFALGFAPLPAAWATSAQLMVLAIAFAVVALLEPDPLKTGKKKLALTARAARIFSLALALSVAVAAAVDWLVPSILAWLIPVHFVPLSLVLATLLLAPSERRVQAKYWREAEAVLGRIKPVVIGITGSYGKTSTKQLLAHILSVQAPTLATPGSVNTAMGIARIVRERLDRQRWFVVEMGAYGRGSIATLCRLTPPSLGILTTIGKAHYERFGSVDEVAAAKLELAEAAERNGGRMIFGSGAMRHPTVRGWAEGHKPMVVADARILDTAETPQGLTIAVDWQGTRYDLKVPIHGMQQVDNIVLAFAAACTLGVPPSVAAQALASAPQIQHRLEVKTLANGAVLIDDAYNSNPEGFAAGLRLLDLLRKPDGRRILVTPGMVELGAIEEAEHEAIGRLAGGLVDVLLAVSPARIEALTKAYQAANPQGLVVPCAIFADADRWMAANMQANDVVLLENDLPDLYELKLRL